MDDNTGYSDPTTSVGEAICMCIVVDRYVGLLDLLWWIRR